MPDDAPQPPSSFFTSPSRSFAKLTHFIDDNIRIIQYGLYCVGAAGVVVALHSVRAFTKFAKIQDIPEEFIKKHMRLHGHVKWVGVKPPTPKPTPPTLLLKGGDDGLTSSHPNTSPPPDNEATSPPFPTKAVENEVVGRSGSVGRSLSEDNRGIYEGAGELHPWEDGIDPAVDRVYHQDDLSPLYLQVEHSPVISLLQRTSEELLSLQLAAVEVTADGAAQAKRQLVGQRAWFTLVSHNTEYDTLVCFLRPAKVLRRRSVNDELVREGLGLVGPMDLELHGDPFYTKMYTRLLGAQDFAEKKQLGIWKLSHKRKEGILTWLWGKMRSLRGRKK